MTYLFIKLKFFYWLLNIIRTSQRHFEHWCLMKIQNVFLKIQFAILEILLISKKIMAWCNKISTTFLILILQLTLDPKFSCQYEYNCILNIIWTTFLILITYSGSKVFMPRGPSNFFSAISKAFHAFSVVKSSGA